MARSPARRAPHSLCESFLTFKVCQFIPKLKTCCRPNITESEKCDPVHSPEAVPVVQSGSCEHAGSGGPAVPLSVAKREL